MRGTSSRCSVSWIHIATATATAWCSSVIKETTMDPENRMLKQVNLINAAEADRTFSVLMGEEVGPRREFIEAHATYANIDA